MKFEVLISTYNGEKYLKAQLDSILEQTYSNFHITIRDDGSRDSTGKILQLYEREYSDKITWIHDGENLGYPDCFWYLLEHAPAADMYVFCDQDDVWDPKKLEYCREKCEGLDPDVPVLYVHDYHISDGNLNVYEEYRVKQWGYRENYPYNLLYFVMVSGFAMTLNGKLRERILRDELMGKHIPHDRWIFWSGFFAGKIVCDDRMLVTYRRHDRTVTITGKGNLALLKEWWKGDILGDNMKIWEEIGQYFADLYRDEMERKTPGIEKDWRLLYREPNTVGAYLRRLFFPKRIKPTLPGEIVLRISFLLNR